MSIRSYIIALFILSLIPTIAHAIIIGASPETQTLCMGPGETAFASFSLSTNATDSFSLNPRFESPELQLSGDSYVRLIPNSNVNYDVYVIEPEQGYYNTSVYFCTSPSEQQDYNVGYCLKTNLLVNVTPDCTQYTPYILPIIQNREILTYVLFTLLIIAVLIFIKKNLK